MRSLGIDIGGMSVKAALWDGRQCAWTGQSGFYSKPTTRQLTEAIRQAVNGRAQGADAVGLCAPGLLDAARRVITYAINVPGVMGISLDDLAPGALGIEGVKRTVITNDAVATAEDIFRSRKISGRLLVLGFGTGVGAAVLDDGKALRVEGESPGHLGQVDVSIAGHDVIAPDGGAGGLEGYIGAAALRRTHGEDVSAALARFKGEEPEILALVRAVRIAHAFYRPNHIWLCGGIGVRLRHLLSVIREKVGTHLTSLAQPGWTLSCGEDDFHAARGAARLASGQSGV